MTASIARVGHALHVGPRVAWLIAAGGVLGVVSAAAVGVQRDVLLVTVGAAVLGVGILLGLKWPILPLALFAAMIPIEEVLLIDGFGTISRFAGILFAVTYAVPRLGRLRLGVMPPAAWAFVAWALVSVLWAIDPARAVGQLATLLQLFLIAFLVADFVLRQPAIVRPVLWVYTIASLATAALGIVAFLTVGTRATVFQDQNPEHFAAILTPALLFGLHEGLTGSRRLLGAAITLVTTTAVISTGTRAAWIAVVVVVLLYMLPQLTPRRRMAMAAMGAVLIAAALQVPGVAELIGERASTALSTGGSGRVDIWSVAGTIYSSAPLLGVGHANFPVAYTFEAVRASDVVSWVQTEGRGAHNLIVLTLVELGPVGLLLLTAFLGPPLLRRGWGPEALVVQASLAALLIQALFVDMFSNRKPVWLMIGFAMGLAYLARRERAKAGDQLREQPSPQE